MKKALIAEDNPIMQKISKAMLEKLDYQIDIASTGSEAAALAACIDYDIILMDCFMPVMDGFESTKQIRSSDNPVKIIGITANADKESKKECLDVGMDEFLPKPITQKRLAQVLSKWNQ